MGSTCGPAEREKCPDPTPLWGPTSSSCVFKGIHYIVEKNNSALVCMRWGKKLAWPVSVKQGCCSLTHSATGHTCPSIQQLFQLGRNFSQLEGPIKKWDFLFCHIKKTLDPNEENLLKKFRMGRICTMQLLSQPSNFALKGKLSSKNCRCQDRRWKFSDLSLEFESGLNPDVRITSTPLENSDLNIDSDLCMGRGNCFSGLPSCDTDWVGKN